MLICLVFVLVVPSSQFCQEYYRVLVREKVTDVGVKGVFLSNIHVLDAFVVAGLDIAVDVLAGLGRHGVCVKGDGCVSELNVRSLLLFLLMFICDC